MHNKEKNKTSHTNNTPSYEQSLYDIKSLLDKKEASFFYKILALILYKILRGNELVINHQSIIIRIFQDGGNGDKKHRGYYFMFKKDMDFSLKKIFYSNIRTNHIDFKISLYFCYLYINNYKSDGFKVVDNARKARYEDLIQAPNQYDDPSKEYPVVNESSMEFKLAPSVKDVAYGGAKKQPERKKHSFQVINGGRNHQKN